MSAVPKLDNLVPFDEKTETAVDSKSTPAEAPAHILRLAPKPPPAPAPAFDPPSFKALDVEGAPPSPFHAEASEVTAVGAPAAFSPPAEAHPAPARPAYVARVAPADSGPSLSPDQAFERGAAEDLTGEVVVPPRRGVNWQAWVRQAQRQAVDLYDRFQYLPTHVKRAITIGSASVGVLATGWLVIPHHRTVAVRPMLPPPHFNPPAPQPVVAKPIAAKPIVQAPPKPLVKAPPPAPVAAKAAAKKPVAGKVAKAAAKKSAKKKAVAAKKSKKGKAKLTKSKAKKGKKGKLAKSKTNAKAKKVAANSSARDN
jgi:hypothetical protein